MAAPQPISPDLVTDATTADQLPAYVSNGVIGLRVRDVPTRVGMATLSGLEGEHPSARVACVPPAPYPVAADVKVDSTWISEQWQHVHATAQRYDFATGELHSEFDYSYDGVDVHVTVLTFCSRSQPSLAAQEVTVAPSAACEITVAAGIDPTGIPGGWLERSTSVPDGEGEDIDGTMHWETLGALGSCGAAYWTECSAKRAERSKDEERQRPLTTSYRVGLRAGQHMTVRQVTSLVPSTNHQQPHRHATRFAALGQRMGFETLRRENAEAWESLWRARVVLVGADRQWQSLADAAFFYLHTSTHPGSMSTHPFGLAQWKGYHYYYGHVMWDVESFLLPPLLLTNPDAAAAMLDFRSRTMKAARENARLTAHRGLQFPWEASPSRGEEATPALGPAAAYEMHVTPDVAKAFADYAHVTGDDVFLGTTAWPVLAGAAEWLVSRAVRTDRGWEIRNAMGIAERKEPKDNPAYVNMIATVVLREALACAARCGYQPPAAWREMADGLVLPMNDAGVILDHDGFTRREEKASTPAALAGLFPVGYPVDERVEQKTLRFYLDMADDYAGSPMLSPFLGAWAARLNDRARSAQLFEAGFADFASPRFNVVHEYRSDKFPEQPVSGPFLANIGGFLVACLYGLTGIRLHGGEPETWCERPVTMPELWDAVEVERVWARGRPMSLRAKHGAERAELEPCG
jgi:hypothetical protein